MILIRKHVLNLFSKDRPSWQERYDRRLALLKFAGIRFWTPEDFALAGPIPPEIQRSVSAFPHGVVQAADGGASGGTLTLNTLSAFATDDFLAVAAIQFKRDGNVSENGVNQNPSSEWIDTVSSTVGDDYEAKMDRTGGSTTPTYSGGTPTWSENTYGQIDTTLQALVSSSSGTENSTGTAYVREIANTSNIVSAGFTISATQFGGGIFL